MQRKLIKVGTSAAVIIPKAMLEEQGVKIGDIVHIEISKKTFPKAKFIDPKIMEWLNKFMERNGPVLKELAALRKKTKQTSMKSRRAIH